MILCCGEALIDMLPRQTTDGEEAFTPKNGGAVFNTAVALGRLGAPAGMLTGLSTDMFGVQLRDMLESSQVDTSYIIESDRPSTLAFVRLKDGHATYSFFDENSAGRMLTPQDMPKLPENVKALYFSCISLVCEPAADAYAALAAAEGDTRAVMLDPNIRTTVIEDETRYRDRLDRMLGLADIVKVSDEDLEWMVPGEGALEDKARGLLDRGPSLVFLTKGGDGVVGFLPGQEPIRVPAERVTVVDTVGAGDTFSAGVLTSLHNAGWLEKSALRGLTPEAVETALAFGAKVAAITVSRAGANPPWASEL